MPPPLTVGAIVDAPYAYCRGDYMREATGGVDIDMEIEVKGVPIRTFDAPLGAWANGKLSSYDDEVSTRSLMHKSLPVAMALFAPASGDVWNV